MISIVDYGVGNIRAITNALARVAVDCELVSTKEQLLKAKKLILPGVGAFDETISKLNQSGMRETLDTLVIRHEVPVMGICVGMQIMSEKSEEGVLEGLGWFENSTTLKLKMPNSVQLPGLPHMGWNSVVTSCDDDILGNIDLSHGFYFLHSFHVQCMSEHELLTSEFGTNFTCAIKKKNIYGFQFHPEKSHTNGRNLFFNFSKV